MKRRIIIGCILACLVLTMTGCAETAALAETATTGESLSATLGNSRSNPGAVGETIRGIIMVLGTPDTPYDPYVGAPWDVPEPYDVKVTLLEVVRGGEAWERIKTAEASNKPPEAGFEYILARIKFGYYARGYPGNRSYKLTGGEFAALSADGREYETPYILSSPTEAGYVFYSGDAYEVLIALLVAKDDEKPLMLYRLGNIWFQLLSMPGGEPVPESEPGTPGAEVEECG